MTPLNYKLYDQHALTRMNLIKRWFINDYQYWGMSVNISYNYALTLIMHSIRKDILNNL